MTQSRDRAFCYRTWVERQRMRRCGGGLPAAAASAERSSARARGCDERPRGGESEMYRRKNTRDLSDT